MSKKIHYKKNSIIYFRGEEAKEVFLVSEGEVKITSFGGSGYENKTKCFKGDFFGLHSAIAGIGRNDDAMSITDVSLIVFNVAEFKELITTTPKLSLQLMQMLSHELRLIHKKSKELMNVHSEVSSELGLYTYAKTYYEKNDYKKACYVLSRYSELYPNGKHINEILEMVQEAKGYAQ